MEHLVAFEHFIPLAAAVLSTVVFLALVYFAIRYLAYKRSFPLPHQFDFLWVLGSLLALVLVGSFHEPFDGMLAPKAFTALAFVTLLLFSYTFIFLLDQFIVEYFMVSVLKVYVAPPLRKAIVLFIFLVAAVICVQKIFSINPWAIYAPTSLLSLGIGIALKDTFQMFFAGVALSTIVRIGDWIEVGALEGEVIEINWARTVLRTWEGDSLFIPNSELQKGTFKSFNYKSRKHRCRIEIGASYNSAPEKVKEILSGCAASVSGVIQTPAPEVLLLNYGESGVLYALTFWVDHYGQRRKITSDVATRVWYAFKRKGIEIPYPIRTIHMLSQTPLSGGVPMDEVSVLLADVDLFKTLSENEFKYVAGHMVRQVYLKGEVAVQQGKSGNSLYIVAKGSFEVLKQTKEGNSLFVNRLGVGEFFGELSLLTGEARSATVRAAEDSELLRLDKEVLREVMSKDPALAGKIASVVAVRRAKLSGIQEKSRSEVMVREEADDLSNQIRNFFNLE